MRPYLIISPLTGEKERGGDVMLDTMSLSFHISTEVCDGTG